MTDNFWTTDIDGDTRVATLTLTRPPMNALSSTVFEQFADAVGGLDPEHVGAAVITGGPKVFAAGADIKEFPHWSPEDASANAAKMHAVLRSLETSPIIFIAAIHGYALGGGCELALACDFRIAADNAKLGQPEILLGIIPGAGGTQRLPRLIGTAKAKDLILTGRMVDANEALELGLIDQWVPADDVLATAQKRAATYAAGPKAVGYAKLAVERGMDMTLDEGLAVEADYFRDAFATEDSTVGIASFVEHGPGKAAFTHR